MSEKTSNKEEVFVQQPKHVVKFIIMSAIGAFLFLAPIPTGDGGFNIPLGHAIGWLEGIFEGISFGTYAPETMAGEFGFHYMLALIAITISFVGALVTAIVKPAFILNNKHLKAVFETSPLYLIARAIAFAVVWMIFLGVGPDFIIQGFTGDLMIGLTSHLMVVFILLAPTMPLITSFGLMEFAGVMVQRFIRRFFTLPGRASVDLLASWFGSSAASIIITRDQHEKGYYTAREAAVIMTNFSFVSLPFTFVVASAIDLQERFLLFYLIVCLVCILLAVLMPRIWPLKNITDTYKAEAGKQIVEEVPSDVSTFKWSVYLASKKANETKAEDIVKTGINNYLDIFMDLIPIILSLGTVALIIVEFTDVFDYLAWPMAQLLNLLGVEGATEFAPATLLGFIDMYIPALIIGDAVEKTRFILGVLSIVQIIYLAETGALIIKSKVGLGIGKLLILFLMRTLIALPIIVLLTHLFF